MAEPFQAHIQRLMQAGIATHLVAHSDAVDPLFALSKVRDFPEVTFAAVFEDGIVVLGCHGSLPEPLQALAKPIQPQAVSANNDLEEKIDALSALITSQQDPNEATDLSQQIASMPKVLDAQSQATESVQDRLSQIDGRLTSLGDETTAKLAHAMPDLTPLVTGFDQLREEITKGFAENENQTGSGTAHQLAVLLADFEARLQSRLAAEPETPELAAQTSEIASEQRVLHKKLADMALDLKALTAMQGAEVSNGRDSFADDVVQLHQRLDALADLDTRVAAISSEISAMSQRPDPVIDLTAQRQSLARFENAMTVALGRLETETARIAAFEPDKDGSGLAALTEQISGFSDHLAQVTELPTRLTDIDEVLREIPKQQKALATAVSALEQRPDPVLDLTEQRRSFAQFTTALSTAIARLETLAHNDTPKALAAVAEKLGNLATQESDTPADEAVAQLLSDQQEEIASLRQDVTLHLQRPGPVLDLTRQRTSLAQFGTALGAMLTRFERIASQLEQAAPDSPSIPVADDMPDAPLKVARVFDKDDISLEAMRFNFAELIAKQIMQNTNAGQSGTPCATLRNS